MISEDFRERLVDVWVNELIQHPEKHDKVEFEIVPTCYTFDLDNLMQTLLHSGMTEKEVKIFYRGTPHIDRFTYFTTIFFARR